MTDGELVRQTLAGRPAAFAELARRWSARVVAICRVHAGMRGQHVEDLAQDALLRAFQALATLEDQEKFGAWLRGIAVRVCLDHRKRKQTGQVPFSLLDRPDAPFEVASQTPDASELVEQRETQEELRAHVAGLPDDCREVLVLYYQGDSTYQDLADMFGVSRATINLRLTKARTLLRERFGQPAADGASKRT